MSSLTLKITLLAVLVFAAIEVSFEIVGGATLRRSADRIADAQLMQGALTLDALFAAPVAAGAPAVRITPTIGAGASAEADGTRRLMERTGFQYWGANNELVAASDGLRGLALDAVPAGYSDIVTNRHRWRVLTLLAADGRWVRVGAREDSARVLTRIFVVRAALLLGVGIPLLFFLISRIVRSGFAPVGSLTERIAVCSPSRSQPIAPGGLPRELEPIVASVNALLTRFKTPGSGERRLRIAHGEDGPR